MALQTCQQLTYNIILSHAGGNLTITPQPIEDMRLHHHMRLHHCKH